MESLSVPGTEFKFRILCVFGAICTPCFFLPSLLSQTAEPTLGSLARSANISL